jgi:hypothetical protein
VIDSGLKGGSFPMFLKRASDYQEPSRPR